jgi:hypothetical protein
MANYPPKKYGSSERIYTMHSDNKSYILKIRETVDSILLYIGGPAKYCLECQIYTENSFMKQIKDITIGDLPHVYYNEGCGINQKIVRGDDTKHLLRLCIAYLRKTYPKIRGLTLNDESYRECDDRQTVDLANMYYILHGKTWYMSTLGATFLNESDAKLFHNCEVQFNQYKQSMTWENMNEFITVKLPIEEANMKQLYESAETWQSFFTGIRNTIGISKFCSFIAPWIQTFMETLFKFKFGSVKFITMFDNPTHKPYAEYTLQSYTPQGGKYTRKAPRKRVRDLK